MDQTSIILAALGGITLLLGLLSKRLDASPFPTTLVALGFGILLGPACFDVIDLSSLGERAKILEEAARVTLAVGLAGVALSVSRVAARRNWRQVVLLLVLVMPFMWIISTGLLMLILHLDFWTAAMIGALIAPTDPVASNPILAGAAANRNVPEAMRNVLSLESGANDGLGYPLVLLGYLMISHSPASAWHDWLVQTLLLDVVMTTLLGVLIGVVAGKVFLWADARDVMADKWRMIFIVALALFSVGFGRVIRSDEVLLVFASCAAFVQVIDGKRAAEATTAQDAIDRFFSVPMFTVLGIAIPWDGWKTLGWQGVALAVAVLLLRRPPVLLVLRPLLGTFRDWRDALFAGWFGPIGVAAIYYAGFMEHKLGDPRIWYIASLVVCASTVAHGLTAAPLTRVYGRIVRKAQESK